MRPIKKIEIICDQIKLKKLIAILEENNIVAYTKIDGVKGRGSRGVQDAEDLTGIYNNSYLLIACEEKQFENVKEMIREVLQQSGGICIVSDAMEIIK